MCGVTYSKTVLQGGEGAGKGGVDFFLSLSSDWEKTFPRPAVLQGRKSKNYKIFREGEWGV